MTARRGRSLTVALTRTVVVPVSRLLLVGACSVLFAVPAQITAQTTPTPAQIAIWRKAANTGDAAAQLDLAEAYQFGTGVPKDAVEAVSWYRLAAAQGRAYAQSALGYAYAFGAGVPKNDVESVKWYRLAAAQGSEEGQVGLGFAYVLGEDVPKNDVEAYHWLNLAAAQGNPSALRQRDKLEAKMTRAQIAEAQRRSATFKAVKTPPGRP